MKQNNYTAIPFSNDPKFHKEKGNICNDPEFLARKSFENGEEFYKSSILLWPHQNNMKIVTFTNLAFSCELYLKSILYYVNKEGKVVGHNIFKLFNQLPSDIRDEIKTNTDFKYQNPNQFDLFFQEVGETFTFIRYCHEVNSFCVHFDLFALAKSIRSSALKLYNEQVRLKNEIIVQELEKYKKDNKTKDLICWVNYSNEYNDSIKNVATQIVNNLEDCLKRDYIKFDCSKNKDECFAMSIKMVFSRENYWLGHEYAHIMALSSKVLNENDFSFSGFRTTGRIFSFQQLVE